MRAFKLRVMQNIKTWYSIPMDVEIKADTASIALVLAWNNAIMKGINVKDIILLTK